MFYGIYKSDTGYHGGIYYNLDSWHRDTFYPGTEVIALFDLKAHGKTYAEKKTNVQDNAIEYSNTCGLIEMSYMELAIIQDYFRRYGKRYGLMAEFTENVIC